MIWRFEIKYTTYMKRNSMIVMAWIAVALFAMVGCHKDMDEQDANVTSETIDFQVAVEGGSNPTVTRASGYSYFASGTELKVGIVSNDTEINTSQNGQRVSVLRVEGSGASQTYSINPKRFWNDWGGRNADINLWGLYTDG